MYTITLPEYFSGPIDSPVASSSPLQSTLYTVTFFTVVQLLTHVQLFATPWTAAHQASLSFTISWSVFRLTSIELVMPSNHLILCCLLLLLSSTFSSIRVFSNESVLCTRWPVNGDFPGCPAAKTLCSQYKRPRSIPGQGTRSHTLQLRVCTRQ